MGFVGTLFLFQRIVRRGVQADAGTDEAAGTVRAQVDGIHASGHQHPISAGGIVKIIITAFATDFQLDGSGGLLFVQEHRAYAYRLLFRPGQREGRLAAHQRLSEHEIVFLVL